MTQTSGKRVALHKFTLTKRAVDALEPGDKPWIAWDDRLTGFGVRVQPSGVKSFIVSYRPGGGRKAPNKRVVLGRHGKIAPERARQMAQQVLGAVAGGADPARDRAGARAMPVLADAFEDYMAANPDRAPRTVFLYRQVVRLCLDDWLARPLDAIARRDVEDRFNRITANHGWSPANQAISLLRSIYRRPCVDRQGLRNPVDRWLAGGGKYHGKVRRKISAPAEALPCWRAGIEAEVASPVARDAFWFGLYTGMRLNEVLPLRWERVDIEGRVFRVEETKTGVALELPITRQLGAVLDRRRQKSGTQPEGWVFPSAASASGPDREPGAILRPDRRVRRGEVLVPWSAQLLHHRGRARPDAAALADQAAGQSRPARRHHRGIRRRLDHRATARAGAEDCRQDRGADERNRGGGPKRLAVGGIQAVNWRKQNVLSVLKPHSYLKIAGSNPAPATTDTDIPDMGVSVFVFSCPFP